MQQSRHYLFVKTLLNRLKVDDLDAPAIEQEFYRLEAGLSGEQKLKRLLSDYHFRSPSHIFYNFECINSKGFTHQMDALLITPHFVVIMEVNQKSGTFTTNPPSMNFPVSMIVSAKTSPTRLIRRTVTNFFWSSPGPFHPE